MAATRLMLKNAGVTTANCITADFLTWNLSVQASFDCIIMNPPFAAMPTGLRRLAKSSFAALSLEIKGGMAVEAAFVCRAIELLKDKGRLVSIVPASIVMSQRLQWLRSLLMEKGLIKLVHELPTNSFAGVEARLYLMVFDKGSLGKRTKLQSSIKKKNYIFHANTNAHELLHRLDYGYHHAASQMRILQQDHAYTWRNLSSLATVIRGNVQSPNWQAAVHTTNCHNGIWHKNDARKSDTLSKFSDLKNGDLLMKRVGRNCHQSIGSSRDLEGLSCSDCVFIIRPTESSAFLPLLFSLYCMFQISWIKPLLERGTAASYVCLNNLRNFPIPVNLPQAFPHHFRLFTSGESMRFYDHLILSASDVARQLSAMQDPALSNSLLPVR